MRQMSFRDLQGDRSGERDGEEPRTISPYLEMGAWEALWQRPDASFSRLADVFRHPTRNLPSDWVDLETARHAARKATEHLHRAGVAEFGVQVRGTVEYPERLLDARHPADVLYYRGWWNFIESPAVAVVGTRRTTERGRWVARELTEALVEDGWSIVSGLAEGIDTIAHRAALAGGGLTIGVLGTPLSAVYPLTNRALQEEIGDRFLLVSQVPVLRHAKQDFRQNRFFFPARNATISALSEATIIVEISASRGSKIQAEAAVGQGRALYLHDLCFDKGEHWPFELIERGVAQRFSTRQEMRNMLGAAATN